MIDACFSNSSVNDWVGCWKRVNSDKVAMDSMELLLKNLGVKKFKRLYVSKHDCFLDIRLIDGGVMFKQTVGKQYTRNYKIKLPIDKFDDFDEFSNIESTVISKINEDQYSIDFEALGKFGVLTMSRGLLENGNFGIVYLLKTEDNAIKANEEYSRFSI